MMSSPHNNRTLAAIALVALAAALVHIAFHPSRGLFQLALWTVWLVSVILGIVLSSNMIVPALSGSRRHLIILLKALFALYVLAILANAFFTWQGAPLFDAPSPMEPFLGFLAQHSVAFWISVGLLVPAYFLVVAIYAQQEHS